MRAASAMTREVVVIRPDFPLAYAWDLMREHKIRHLPVAVEGTVEGMLSDRDVLTWSTRAPSGELEVPDVLVRRCMSSPVITCHRETPVSEIARILTTRKIDALPVLGVDKRLVGLVTSTDLMELLAERPSPELLPFDFRLLTPNQQHQIRGAV